MSRRRSFTPEYKAQAARRVIDGGRPATEVARELNVHEIARCRPTEAAGERAERTRLRAELAERDRDVALRKKVSAYYAAQHHR